MSAVQILAARHSLYRVMTRVLAPGSIRYMDSTIKGKSRSYDVILHVMIAV